MRSALPQRVVAAAAAKPAPKKKTVATKKAGSAPPSPWYGSERVLYLPGGLLDRDEISPVLDGTLPGDYGYDPLGLATDEETLEKFRAAELIHGRWAMLGAFGALLPEIIDRFGGNIPGAVWWQTGAVQLANQPLNYLGGIPTLPLPANAAITAIAFFFLEKFRADGAEVAGIPAIFPNGPETPLTGLDKLYPGGDFDPLGFSENPEALAELKVKEIKNGRLAMVSMLGFAAQAAVTHEGPFANLQTHLADPFGGNLLSVLAAGRGTPVL